MPTLRIYGFMDGRLCREQDVDDALITGASDEQLKAVLNMVVQFKASTSETDYQMVIVQCGQIVAVECPRTGTLVWCN